MSHWNPTKGVPPLAVSVAGKDKPDDECHWFLGCRNAADKDVEHPTLGWVLTCDDHIAWLQED
jgi:hypothetical protein